MNKFVTTFVCALAILTANPANAINIFGYTLELKKEQESVVDRNDYTPPLTPLEEAIINMHGSVEQMVANECEDLARWLQKDSWDTMVLYRKRGLDFRNIVGRDEHHVTKSSMAAFRSAKSPEEVYTISLNTCLKTHDRR